MKNFMMACCFLFVLSACNQPEKASNPKFDYKIIKRQFEPFTGWKKDKATAMEKVDEVIYYSAKAACKKIGQGWAYTKIENSGRDGLRGVPRRISLPEKKCSNRVS